MKLIKIEWKPQKIKRSKNGDSFSQNLMIQLTMNQEGIAYAQQLKTNLATRCHLQCLSRHVTNNNNNWKNKLLRLNPSRELHSLMGGPIYLIRQSLQSGSEKSDWFGSGGHGTNCNLLWFHLRSTPSRGEQLLRCYSCPPSSLNFRLQVIRILRVRAANSI